MPLSALSVSELLRGDGHPPLPACVYPFVDSSSVYFSIFHICDAPRLCRAPPSLGATPPCLKPPGIPDHLAQAALGFPA